MKNALVGLLVGTLCGTCQAQYFSGPAFFSVAPNSQLGAVTNNLVINNTANGFIVTGQAIINVLPAPVGGTLVMWQVDRPLNPGFGTGTFTTSTVLNGFSAPPVGTFGLTSGSVTTVNTTVGGPSTSFVPMSLVGGIDTPIWNNLTNSSGPFLYTSGGVNFVRQVFQLDGVYLTGPGGNWVIDVPVSSFFVPVPEPGSMLLASAILVGGVALYRRRRAA